MTEKIKLLDKATADKIAAGEVVENPASIVKELVENSIDAGATRIVMEIEKGGKSLIRVTDNGEGMEKKDVPRAFMRHATSKIEQVEDLDKIHSLGFRGEALASIAAVSRVTLTTKTGNDLEGTLYSINGGKEAEYSDTGCPRGTSIEVRDLFYNTPARREYLKSDTRETALISDIISRLALSRTDVSFQYISNERTLINTPGNGNLLDTVASIYGREMAENLVRVGCTNQGIEIKGLVSRPHFTRATRSHQTFYINGRYVKSSIIAQALLEAYRTLVMVNRYPVAVLFILFDPDQVDVNVHPAKLQVRFKESEKIRKTVVDCVRASLEKGKWIARPAQSPSFRKKFDDGRQEKLNLSTFIRKQASVTPVIEEENYQAKIPEEKTCVYDAGLEYNREEVDSNIKDDKNRIPDMRIVGQFLSTFIMAEGEECIYIIDQHAAHERIVYEQLVDSIKDNTSKSQRLIEPEVIELSPAEMEIIYQNRDMLTRMGFELDDFGMNAIAIRAVPVFFGVPQTREFLTDIIDGFSQANSGKNSRLKGEDIIRMSCRKAVKANQKLSVQEMKALIDQLSRTKMPFTCPHGRPVIITITRYELEKMFKRIV